MIKCLHTYNIDLRNFTQALCNAIYKNNEIIDGRSFANKIMLSIWNISGGIAEQWSQTIYKANDSTQNMCHLLRRQIIRRSIVPLLTSKAFISFYPYCVELGKWRILKTIFFISLFLSDALCTWDRFDDR